MQQPSAKRMLGLMRGMKWTQGRQTRAVKRARNYSIGNKLKHVGLDTMCVRSRVGRLWRSPVSRERSMLSAGPQACQGPVLARGAPLGEGEGHRRRRHPRIAADSMRTGRLPLRRLVAALLLAREGCHIGKGAAEGAGSGLIWPLPIRRDTLLLPPVLAPGRILKAAGGRLLAARTSSPGPTSSRWCWPACAAGRPSPAGPAAPQCSSPRVCR